MPRRVNQMLDLPDNIKLFAELQRIPGTTSYTIRVRSEPTTNRWFLLAYFMEVVGTLANAQVGDNPKGIKDSEAMADHIAGYMINVVMHSTSPPNERTQDNGKTPNQ